MEGKHAFRSKRSMANAWEGDEHFKDMLHGDVVGDVLDCPAYTLTDMYSNYILHDIYKKCQNQGKLTVDKKCAFSCHHIQR